MTRNIRVFLVCEALLAGFGGFILPIYVMYFRYYSITLLQVALLATTFEAAVLVFEIPTGLLADRFGRKLSVIIGFALFACSGGVFIWFRSFEGFLVAEVLFGLAEAFISGAGEALAVDSITAPDKKPLLKILFTQRSRIRIAVTSVCMLAAGWAFAHNADVTFYPVLVAGILGIVASFFFIRNASQAEAGQSLFAPVGKMLKQLRAFPILKIIFWTSLAANFAFEGADQYWQVLGSEMFDIDVTYFGVITAIGAIAAFILVGPLVKRYSGNVSLPILIVLLAGVAISSMPNITESLLPSLLVIYFICKELIRPLFSTAINSIISSQGRATFLSGYNLTCSIGEVAAGLTAGGIATYLGLPVVFVLCGGLLVLFTLVMLFFSQLRRG